MKNKKVFLVVDPSILIPIGLDGILSNNFNYLLLKTNKHADVIKSIRNVKINLIFLEIIENKQMNLSIISEIRIIQPNIEILVFTECNDKFILNQLKKTLNVHVLEKTASKNEIIRKVSNILDINKKIKTKRLDSFRLSERERQIAKMLLDGMRIVEISNLLDLSMTTISTYKYRIFKKYKVKNILELEKVFQS